MIPFTFEQAGALANLRQAYDHWMTSLRERERQPYGMRFVKRGDREYLYEFHDRSNNGRSLGPRSPEADRALEAFRKARADVDSRISGAWERVEQNSKICRALQVPAIAHEAGRILVELDKREILGHYVMVAGTNAVFAYNIEAGGPLIIGADIATDDFDLLWSRDHQTSLVVRGDTPSSPPSILAALKSVDETYTVNEERPFQLRNRSAYEVEILVPPSRLDALPKGDRLRPATNLDELEWLIGGTAVEQVTPAKGDGIARIVAPDPRMFALQKLFIAEKPNRDSLKKNKDRRQGDAILDACRSGDLPRHPLTGAFIAGLPAPLMPHWRRWADRHGFK